MRIKQPVGFAIVQILLALAAGLQAGQLLAQSTDLESNRQEVAQAKKIIQEIRAGNTPTMKELDFLDDVLSHLASTLTPGPTTKGPANAAVPPTKGPANTAVSPTKGPANTAVLPTKGPANTAVLPTKGPAKQALQTPEQKPIESKPVLPLTIGFSETKTTSAVVYAYVIDSKSDALRCFWRDKHKMPYDNILNLRDDLVEQGTELRFAINGGIYERDFHPKGLYIEQGNMISDLDKTHPGPKAGNFYLEPNGVFLIDAKGVPRIVTTDRFMEEFPDSKKSSLRLAIQSGPALLVDREINFQFAESSQNRLRRSGVGVLPDGRIVFAISREDVSFREFAAFFKETGCTDALYLDGGPIPSFYVERGLYLASGSDLVTMCGVVVSTAANRNQIEDPR